MITTDYFVGLQLIYKFSAEELKSSIDRICNHKKDILAS
jgi:hypothetical protein